MKLYEVKCPNCNGEISVEDNLDFVFCKYCGHKIILEPDSDAAYDAKVKIKNMEHTERLQDKHDAHERYKIENENKKNKAFWIGWLAFMGVMFLIFFIMSSSSEKEIKEQEEKLQATVEQIMIDIENEDFAEAYVKANTLYWDDTHTSEGKEKWDATRKEIINQIIEAEIKATGSSTHKPEEEEEEEDKGFLEDLFG